jgi:hypothetical protein
MPLVPTLSEEANVPNTGKERSAVTFEKLPSISYQKRSLPSADEIACVSSATYSLSLPPVGKLAETSNGGRTSSPPMAKETVYKEDLLNLLKQGVGMWNQWRKEQPELQPDLSGTDPRGATLRKVDFRGVNLNGADLSETCLAGADLCKADLRNASLRKPSPYRANLSGADPSMAALRYTFLRKANLFEQTSPT